MSTRNKVANIAFTGVAVTGMAGFAPAPAMAAASTWTVTNGGPFTAHNTRQFVFRDVTANQTITCPVSVVTAAGSVPNVVSKPTGAGIGTVTQFSLGRPGAVCPGPFGFQYSWHGVSLSRWHINAASQASGTSVTHVTITGFHLRGGLIGLFCTFDMSGTASGTYTNATGVLKISRAGTLLHIHNVVGCAGLFANSHSATVSGPLTITTAGSLHPQIVHNTA
jgi:hypothetical protein